MTGPDGLAKMDALLMDERPEIALEMFRASGGLAELFPEVAALVDFHEGFEAHHKDLWAHTLQVVAKCPTEPELRWVALFHDTGKVGTRDLDERGRVTFWRHEQASAALFEVAARRLGMSVTRLEQIAFVIANHGRFNAYRAAWSDQAIRRLVRDAGPHLERLMAFTAVDVTTANPALARRIKRRVESLHHRIQQVLEPPASALPRNSGRMLMAAFGWEAGPQVGEALRWLESQVSVRSSGASSVSVATPEKSMSWSL